MLATHSIPNVVAARIASRKQTTGACAHLESDFQVVRADMTRPSNVSTKQLAGQRQLFARPPVPI